MGVLARPLLRRIDRLLLGGNPELGRLPYVWLIYLGFLFFPLTLGQGGARLWLPTLASLAVFLPLYFWAFRLQGTRVLLPMALMVGLAVLLAPFNPSSLCYAVYAAAFAPGLGSARRGLFAIAGVVLTTVAAFLWLGLPAPFLIMAALIPVLVGVSNLYFAEMERKNAELKLTQQEVRRLAGQAERERIARDLHDLLGHTLSVMIRKTELARRLVARDAARADAELAEIERIGRQALSEVRTAISGWRTPELAAEAASVRLALESSGVAAEIDDPPPLPEAAGAALAMVLREAATNVIRHAGARRCRVEFAREGGRIAMRVSDDGQGGAPGEGNGIRGMRERLAAVGGSLQIVAGARWVLTAEVPLAEAAP
jgi:two-component system sensor histidine kinase DesK